MNREEQIKAAIVVTPDDITFFPPEEHHAAENMIFFLNEIVDFMQSLNPELERHEAMVLTSIFLKTTPRFFDVNPEMIQAFKQEARRIISQR